MLDEIICFNEKLEGEIEVLVPDGASKPASRR
jgi:hypothetical protein